MLTLFCYTSMHFMVAISLACMFAAVLIAFLSGATIGQWTPVDEQGERETLPAPEPERDTIVTGYAPPVVPTFPSLPAVLSFLRTIPADPADRMYTVDVGDGSPFYTMARNSMEAIDRVIDDLRDSGESAPCPLTCKAKACA